MTMVVATYRQTHRPMVSWVSGLAAIWR